MQIVEFQPCYLITLFRKFSLNTPGLYAQNVERNLGIMLTERVAVEQITKHPLPSNKTMD